MFFWEAYPPLMTQFVRRTVRHLGIVVIIGQFPMILLCLPPQRNESFNGISNGSSAAAASNVGVRAVIRQHTVPSATDKVYTPACNRSSRSPITRRRNNSPLSSPKVTRKTHHHLSSFSPKNTQISIEKYSW